MGKKQTQPSSGNSLKILAILAVLGAIAVFAFVSNSGEQPSEPVAQQTQPAEEEHSHPHPEIEPKGTSSSSSSSTGNFRMPPYFEDPASAEPLAPTLDPETVVPEARAGYVVAKSNPKLLTQLPCFCYCDRFGHTSLHTCFETNHAEACDICLKEALEADALYKQGMDAPEIRSLIVAKHHPKS